MRAISDRNIIDAITLKFCKILEKHCKYIVVSGYVAISTGRTRATEDIAVILERLTKDEFIGLHEELLREGFQCVQNESPKMLYAFYLAENAPIRYALKDQELPEMEVKLAKDKLDEIQIENRVKLPITGVDVWFGSIEVNIAFKEELLKSEKDLEDALHLRTAFKGQVDEEKINKAKQLIKLFRLKNGKR